MTRGMGLPEGTRIADTTAGGKAIDLGKVGDMTPSPRLALLEPPTPRPWWRGWRGYVAAAGAVAAVLALAWSARRWVRRGRTAEVQP